MRVSRSDCPIADVFTCIVLAKSIGAGGIALNRRAPSLIPGLIDRPDDPQVRQKRENMPALDALNVFEEDQLPAVITVEDFHKDIISVYCGSFRGRAVASRVNKRERIRYQSLPIPATAHRLVGNGFVPSSGRFVRALGRTARLSRLGFGPPIVCNRFRVGARQSQTSQFLVRASLFIERILKQFRRIRVAH